MTEGAGSTTPGEPYKMKFTDEHGNVGKSVFVYLNIVNGLQRYFILTNGHRNS